ncbi:MAG: hypothetical protein ACHQM6_07690 [Candidatus Kapaibacterium sp.]
MKIFFLFLLTLLGALPARATRPDIDTVSILGLTPGLDGKLVSSHISGKLDTLLWSEDAGVGIVKSAGSYFGNKGEFRIAYDKGAVSQVSFVVPTHDQTESNKIYDQLSNELINSYGPADIETKESIREMRWEGIKQSVSVKAVDATQYVTIALSKFGM